MANIKQPTTKQIIVRVKPSLHAKLRGRAFLNKRTIGMEAALILEDAFTTTTNDERHSLCVAKKGGK